MKRKKKEPALKEYLWQRGLTQYYANDFKGCSQQFRIDVAKNPRDTEEILWAMICDARQDGFKNAQSRMLTLPQPDPRPIMKAVVDVYSGVRPPEYLNSLGESAGIKSSDFFYSKLYLGLYEEIKGNVAASSSYIRTAVDSFYGVNSNDYMASLAKVHKLLRRQGACSVPVSTSMPSTSNAVPPSSTADFCPIEY